MKIRTRAVVMGCAAILATGLSAGTADAEEANCMTSEPVHLSDPGSWSYTYWVTWCAEAGKITTITPHVTHDENPGKCVWVGSVEESLTPVPDVREALNVFNMSEFSCKDATGKPRSVNPWAVITIRPDGGNNVPRKGIGDVIVD